MIIYLFSVSDIVTMMFWSRPVNGGWEAMKNQNLSRLCAFKKSFSTPNSSQTLSNTILLYCIWKMTSNTTPTLVQFAWMKLSQFHRQMMNVLLQDGARKFWRVKNINFLNFEQKFKLLLFIVHLGNALMQYTAVAPLPQADCQSKLEASKIGYTNSLICGVTQQDACQVDIGSALACANRSGRYTLKGVYASETSCGEPNQVVAYTKTDLQWIRGILRSARPTY